MPVLMVVTERGQYDIAPAAPGLAFSLPPAVVRVHAVGPLSRGAAEEFVRGTLGPDTGDTWVDGCVRAGAGNPLLLRALLDDLRTVFPHGGRAAPETEQTRSRGCPRTAPSSTRGPSSRRSRGG